MRAPSGRGALRAPPTGCARAPRRPRRSAGFAVLIGGRGGALLLGPLAVDPAFANQGHGRGLVAAALEAARNAGIALVVLVGDEPYYARLGFRPVPHGQIILPGPVDPERLLAAELVAGALTGYSGFVSADRAAPAA
jgi:predicted N-acetyltransferase YhbS